jgi:molecular chaperone DnaK (HSP70)
MPPQRRADDTPLNNARPKRRKKVSSTSSGPDWRVAIDFGTTNTAIAFSNVKMGNGIIHTLEDFPGDPNPERNGTQVPSEISFQANSSSGSVSLDADRNVLYGYQIRQVLELPDDHPERAGFDEKHLIRKAKLLLDSSEYLATLKSQLVLNVNELKRRGFIERNEEVITDLLKCFLLHTKKTLQKDYGLHERDTGMSLDFVFDTRLTLRCS